MIDQIHYETERKIGGEWVKMRKCKKLGQAVWYRDFERSKKLPLEARVVKVTTIREVVE